MIKQIIVDSVENGAANRAGFSVGVFHNEILPSLSAHY